MVEVEETLFRLKDPGNGSGMFWSRGSRQIVRVGERVFASGYDVGLDSPLYSNTRWQLWYRDSDAWRLAQQGPDFEEREPCLLATLPGGRVLLSVNPARKPIRPFAPCAPHLLQFRADEPEAPPTRIRPAWPEAPRPIFIDHSYRAIAADAESGELFLLNQDVFMLKYGNWPYCWTFMDGEGRWSSCGRLRVPVRGAYPQAALRRRAAHVFSVSDIWEPNERWHAVKLAENAHAEAWDYVFRWLFYSWSPDISRGDFAPPVVVDTVEETGGGLRNHDLWLGPDGSAHVLYSKTNIGSGALRDEFWPGTPIVRTLNHVILKDGEIVRRQTLSRWTEGDTGPRHLWASFHARADGRVFLLCATTAPGEEPGVRNFLMELDERYRPTGNRIPVPLAEPMGSLFTSNERAGAPPSDIIDIQGRGREGGTIRYVRVAA